MEPVVSCCGVVCSACAYYPKECGGCTAIQGGVFWLEYTGGEVCPIYDCCVNGKRLPHCGRCAELPCSRYEQEDPTVSPAENEQNFRMQMARLKCMAAADARREKEPIKCENR